MLTFISSLLSRKNGRDGDGDKPSYLLAIQLMEVIYLFKIDGLKKSMANTKTLECHLVTLNIL